MVSAVGVVDHAIDEFAERVASDGKTAGGENQGPKVAPEAKAESG